MIPRLEEHLVACGLLTAQRAEDAVRSQALVGGTMDTVLLEMGAVPEVQLVNALGEVSGLQPIQLSDYLPDPEMAKELDAAEAERLNLVPLSVEEGLLHVAVPHPVPMRGLEALVRKLGRSVAPWVAADVRVRQWRSRIYGTPLPARESALLATLGPDRALSPEPADASLTLEEQLVQEMAESAARAVASEPLDLLPRTAPAKSLLEAIEAGLAGAEPEPSVSWPAGIPATPQVRRPAPATTVLDAPGPARLRPPVPAGVGARSREPVVEWSLPEARNALRAVAGDREGIKDVVLRYARRTFDFAAMFAVVRGTAIGWDARGERADAVSLAQVSFPLDVPSMFRTAALAHGPYAGPVPSDALTSQVLDALGRRPRSAFVFPVEVRGRHVALVYGDRGQLQTSRRRLAEFILFCQELGAAFAELIVLQKQRRFRDPEAPQDEAGPSTLAVTPMPGPAPEGLGRVRPLRPVERPIADLAPLLERLMGNEAASRAAAIAELLRTPEASARALAAHFPGPTAWSRVPVQELPEPDELGPVPAALARLGPTGARALARLLDADAADTRYVALLTAGSLPYAELVPGVLRGLFDRESDVASAARAAATALRRLPRFQAALPELRQELASRDPDRRILAARALGMLHDRASVEGLIGLTSSDDAEAAQSAAEALADITRAAFGTQTRAWMAWWADNRTDRRAQWLLAALRNPEVWVRAAAIDELTAALGDSLGYLPDAPDDEREAAVKRWEEALLDPRLRSVD
jgi:HEAT repeat protein